MATIQGPAADDSAKKKRMCPAWYYLTGMMALAGAQPLLEKFEAREKVARKSPFDRNV